MSSGYPVGFCHREAVLRLCHRERSEAISLFAEATSLLADAKGYAGVATPPAPPYSSRSPGLRLPSVAGLSRGRADLPSWLSSPFAHIPVRSTPVQPAPPRQAQREPGKKPSGWGVLLAPIRWSCRENKGDPFASLGRGKIQGRILSPAEPADFCSCKICISAGRSRHPCLTRHLYYPVHRPWRSDRVRATRSEPAQTPVCAARTRQAQTGVRGQPPPEIPL